MLIGNGAFVIPPAPLLMSIGKLKFEAFGEFTKQIENFQWRRTSIRDTYKQTCSKIKASLCANSQLWWWVCYSQVLTYIIVIYWKYPIWISWSDFSQFDGGSLSNKWISALLRWKWVEVLCKMFWILTSHNDRLDLSQVTLLGAHVFYFSH